MVLLRSVLRVCIRTSVYRMPQSRGGAGTETSDPGQAMHLAGTDLSRGLDCLTVTALRQRRSGVGGAQQLVGFGIAVSVREGQRSRFNRRGLEGKRPFLER